MRVIRMVFTFQVPLPNGFRNNMLADAIKNSRNLRKYFTLPPSVDIENC